MKEQTVIINKDESGIAEVILNKPELHNAFDEYLIESLTQTFKTLDEDPTVRVVILSARGKSFSAGADLNWMKKMAAYSREENFQDSLKLADLMSTIYHMKCPTIAAVQGSAFGGGVGLVACCDIAIANEAANFCLSEVKLGLIPAVISPYVVKAIGERAAKRYFVTAERFNAERALELNLISEIINDSALPERVQQIASLVLKNGPEAVTAAKKLVTTVADKEINPSLIELTANNIADIRASTQGKEGVTAFLEKRKPVWNGE